MTVKELKERLNQFDDNTEVMFSHNYGDFWRTPVALPIEEIVENEVVFSDYHNSYRIAGESEEKTSKPKTVVVLE